MHLFSPDIIIHDHTLITPSWVTQQSRRHKLATTTCGHYHIKTKSTENVPSEEHHPPKPVLKNTSQFSHHHTRLHPHHTSMSHPAVLIPPEIKLEPTRPSICWPPRIRQQSPKYTNLYKIRTTQTMSKPLECTRNPPPISKLPLERTPTAWRQTPIETWSPRSIMPISRGCTWGRCRRRAGLGSCWGWWQWGQQCSWMLGHRSKHLHGICKRGVNLGW